MVGYTDEPYLRVGPDGVFENLESPASFINRSRKGAAVPDGVDGKAGPRWKKVSSSSTARWHDHRIHWMGSADHPLAKRDPGHRHLLGTWSVPMSQAGSTFTVDGTLAWVPGPSPAPWFGVVLLVAGLAGLVVFALRWSWLVTASLLGLLLVVDVGHVTGTALAGADGFVTNVRRLAGTSAVSLVAWIVLVAAIVLLVRRRSIGWSAAVLGSLLVLGTGGIADAADLSRSQVPFEPGPVAARALVAVTIGLASVVALRAGLEVARRPSAASHG